MDINSVPVLDLDFAVAGVHFTALRCTQLYWAIPPPGGSQQEPDRSCDRIGSAKMGESGEGYVAGSATFYHAEPSDVWIAGYMLTLVACAVVWVVILKVSFLFVLCNHG